MKLSELWKRAVRFFGADHAVRCSVCKRPLRGKSAKVGVGPGCAKKINDKEGVGVYR